MALLARLEEESQKKLDEFLRNIENRDFVWMGEILEEAIKMSSSSSNGEPLLMPKTPSQKNRQKKKRFSSAKHDQFAKKRLSKRDGNRSSSKQICQVDLDITKSNTDNFSPCCRMTRSRALRSARTSHDAFKKPSIHLMEGRIPLVEISANERRSAELQMAKTPPQKEKVALSSTLCDESLIKKSPLVEISANERRSAELQMAKTPPQKEKVALSSTLCDESLIKKSPLVEISANERRSAELHMAKTPSQKEKVALSSMFCDESLTKKSQPLSKVSLVMIPDTPEAQIMKEGRGASKLKIANISLAKTTKSKDPSTLEKTVCIQDQENCHLSEMDIMQNLSEIPQTPRAPKSKRQSVRRSLMGRPSLNCKAPLVEQCSLSVRREVMVQKTLSKHKTAQRSSAACGRASLSNSEKNEEMQKPFKNVGRQASYKRALGETEDEEHTEDKLSPPRKKASSSPCLASKVVRPFKTFLHTVHKNQMLMMTPGSVSRNSTIKSFLKQNTPLRTTPQEKERQRFENLRKKEEAEQHRKQKLEEDKRRRLEDMKRKREERLRKVLQARERVEQMEEEKKKRLEQKLAQHEGKNEKVREEKMAEDKVKKKMAAKKMEEIEARRKQEDEARRQKALQLEEEERRHKELMQKKKEEEQEKARKIAEQRRAELEREKNLIVEKELQKKREQEKLQTQREYERQEKEKADRLQKEVLAAAKEKERLRKEVEEKERKQQEQQKQEEQQKAEAEAKAAKKQLNVTIDIKNSPVCNSYQMTPQSHKQTKIELNDYGMDLNSDDSTDDENEPRKPIPLWALGNELSQAILHQYYNPPNTRILFGIVKSPKLEEIFQKSKPRYFKRTSSAVWNSPPLLGVKSLASTSK